MLDFIGAASALLATILFVWASMWAWPVSLIAVSVDFILYFQNGVYGDMTLQVMYFILCSYGWIRWWRLGETAEGQITYMTWSQRISVVVLTVIAIAVCAYGLLTGLHSPIPWMDASTTVVSVVAQWLTCRRWVEAWVAWFTVDVLYIALYLTKAMPFHVAILPVYVCLAFAGYYRWHRAAAGVEGIEPRWDEGRISVP